MEIVIRSWWVVLFALFCFFCYEQGLKKRNQEYTKLNGQLIEWQETYAKESKLHERLQMQIKSQNDPAWVELILMKELGLVPEGQKKILFKCR